MKSKKALKNILQKTVYLPALEPLLHDAPANILKHVVAQYSKVRKLLINLKKMKLFLKLSKLNIQNDFRAIFLISA